MSRKRPNSANAEPASKRHCVWMDAGVISYKLCTLDYDCERCSLHHALTDGPELVQRQASRAGDRRMIEERFAEWKDRFASLPASARKCRHMLSGEVSYKLCVNAYQCGSCSYDQMITDTVPQDYSAPAGPSVSIDGFALPQNLHFHRGHTWVSVERGGTVRIGLDDFGQWLLGTARGVVLPGVDEPIFQSTPDCEIRIGSGRIGILTPISGRVLATNDLLAERPELINESPFDKGWLVVMRPHDLISELSGLLFAHEAREWLSCEVDRVREKLNGSAGKTRELKTDPASRLQLPGDVAHEFLLSEVEAIES